jgi:hypothetical protein
MAWRIHEYVLRGEIDNRVRNRITGLIWFVGRDEPVKLELTGNAWRNLAGRRIEFVNRAPKPGLPESFVQHQLGITGDFTASRRVKVLDVTVEQAMEMSKKGEKFPFHWANSVYFEWFSALNGRVVIESADYQLTISTDEPSWEMSEADEKRQQLANAAAVEEFMRQITGVTAAEAVEFTIDSSDDHKPKEDWDEDDDLDLPAADIDAEIAAAAAENEESSKGPEDSESEGAGDDKGDDGEAKADGSEGPLTEAAADKLMAEAERLTDALQARIEAAGDSADLETILDEELKRWRGRNGGTDSAAADDAIVRSSWDDVIEEGIESADDPELREELDQRHPLAERARELTLRVMRDRDANDWVPEGATVEHPVEDLVGSIMKAGGKMAGALDGRNWPPSVDECGLSIAWLIWTMPCWQRIRAKKRIWSTRPGSRK